MILSGASAGQGCGTKAGIGHDLRLIGNALLLSILMPSNRPFGESRRAIETALAFCERQDARLIVSDNARDPQKRAMLRDASARLTYLEPEEDGVHANLLNVYAAADTEFIMMMGDDDEIFVSPKDKPLALAEIGEDYLGVRPLVAVANSEGRIIRVKDFAIEGETPGARVMFYNERANGDNAAYYSIFRRKPYVDLHRFFLLHHPLKGGFSDWALACAMFACGKLVYDPGIVFKYNYHRWDNDEKIAAQRAGLFAAVGLPASAERFGLLFLYLDLLILACRKSSPLDGAGKRGLLVEAGGPILSGFCRRVAGEAVDFGPDATALAASITGETLPERQFDLALKMSECVQPGLEARYRAFLEFAIAN